jgi:cytochrome o ubiquinol oxidase subunit 2
MKTYKWINLFVRYCYCSLILILALNLNGCNLNNFSDIEPSGPVARSIDDLFWVTIALMSIVMIPVFSMTAWFIWKYRATNSKATYSPNWDSSIWLEWVVWLFPALIIVILASMTWINTHRLDPYKPLVSALPPLEIQVIALDWKWLFIYPEQNIAMVNELTIPINRPIAFKITSNTVMNSFFIPRLGGQIYAMAGMETQLHLIADKPGSYFGENIQYSGRGFSYQNFEAIASTQQDFDSWVKKAKKSQQTLNLKHFNELVKPSVKDPVTFYSAVTPDLFKQVMNSFIDNPMNNISDGQAPNKQASPSNNLRGTHHVR